MREDGIATRRALRRAPSAARTTPCGAVVATAARGAPRDRNARRRPGSDVDAFRLRATTSPPRRGAVARATGPHRRRASATIADRARARTRVSSSRRSRRRHAAPGDRPRSSRSSRAAVVDVDGSAASPRTRPRAWRVAHATIVADVGAGRSRGGSSTPAGIKLRICARGSRPDVGNRGQRRKRGAGRYRDRYLAAASICIMPKMLPSVSFP